MMSDDKMFPFVSASRGIVKKSIRISLFLDVLAVCHNFVLHLEWIMIISLGFWSESWNTEGVWASQIFKATKPIDNFLQYQSFIKLENVNSGWLANLPTVQKNYGHRPTRSGTPDTKLVSEILQHKYFVRHCVKVVSS